MRRIWGIAATVLALELAVAGRYGFHRDEWYFLVAGRHLAWGYVDQPPLTPLLARISDGLFGPSLLGLRLWPALAVSAVVVLAALIARELGGDERAMTLAAVATAACSVVLAAGHLLSTATVDLLVWVALLWLAARLLRTGEPRLWIAFGAVAGIGLLNKSLVVLLAVALGGGLVLGGRGRTLRSPWLWGGAVLALAIAAPNVLWQAQHGWPQLEMARVLSDRDGGALGSLAQLPLLVVALNLFLAPLWIAGAVRLFRDPVFRPLAWTWVGVLVLTVVSGGKFYYAAPVHVPLFAAGAVAAAERWRQAPGRFRLATLATGVAGLLLIPVALPVLPVGVLARTPIPALNDQLSETVGWDALVARTAAIYDELPASERAHTAILTGSYGEAGAIERLGPALGLPAPVSGQNSYPTWRRPADDVTTVLAVRGSREWLSRFFGSVEQVGTFHSPHDIDNEINGAGFFLCRGPRAPWAELWPRMQFYS